MTPELSRRLAHAMNRGSATPEERRILNLAAASQDVRTVDDLSPQAQLLLRELETRDTALGRAVRDR
jgi:hypothetical protein